MQDIFFAAAESHYHNWLYFDNGQIISPTFFFQGKFRRNAMGQIKKHLYEQTDIGKSYFLSRRRRGRMPYKGRRIRPPPPFTTRGQGTTNRSGPSLLASHLMAVAAPDGEKGKSFLAPLQASLFPKARWGGRRVDVDRNRSLPAFPLPPPIGSSSTVGYTRRRCVGEEGNLLRRNSPSSSLKTELRICIRRAAS